ncbi:MAG: hypothetical protein M5U29_16855 [Anaerolineae bacterium]|nr:hypothetical protein [Anaerolineae bacterium]
MRRVKRRTPLLVLVVVVLVVIVVAVLYLLLGREEEPDKEPPGQDTAQLAAEEALKTLEKLVTAENYAAMGFASLDEVAQAQLGVPMTVYRVQLDHLREYTPGETDPVALLVDVSRQLYPVTVGEEVRSSVAVEESREVWRGTDFGAPGLMKALSQYRQSDDDFAVHVGFLGLYFVGQRNEDGLWLTPLLDDPDLGFVAGEPLAVEEVFRALLPLAQEYKEEAPM